jgi:hypothetical protein
VTTAADPIGAHVAELARAVRGPGRARRSVLREVRDGLVDATDAYRRAGVDPERAARLAVRDFGPVVEVAPLYQDELAAGEGRRTAALLAAGVPAVMAGWNLFGASRPAGAAPVPPTLGALIVAQHVACALVTVTALVLLALTFRRTGSPRRIAAAAVVTVFAAIAGCGGLGLVLNLLQAPHPWLRMTTEPTGLLVYLSTAAMVGLMNRSAARTLCTLRAPRPD